MGVCGVHVYAYILTACFHKCLAHVCMPRVFNTHTFTDFYAAVPIPKIFFHRKFRVKSVTRLKRASFKLNTEVSGYHQAWFVFISITQWFWEAKGNYCNIFSHKVCLLISSGSNQGPNKCIMVHLLPRRNHCFSSYQKIPPCKVQPGSIDSLQQSNNLIASPQAGIT